MLRPRSARRRTRPTSREVSRGPPAGLGGAPGDWRAASLGRARARSRASRREASRPEPVGGLPQGAITSPRRREEEEEEEEVVFEHEPHTIHLSSAVFGGAWPSSLLLRGSWASSGGKGSGPGIVAPAPC
ncbi:unnamed protein product [Prorocentrum cordatum]|uniref:Uncharacterized protein n=1 Tax=Prorocentrum cordatum TaxID=2364126 RepID=A0ABN9S3Z8_9DINO|nr:unnamed protein product [Polarella glacialis]